MSIYFKHYLYMCLLLTTNPIWAKLAKEVDELELSPVVVSATRTSQPLGTVLPSTTLITRDMIQNSQALDLPELFKRQAGIEILKNGGIGTRAAIQMRGANSGQVLILLDGVEIDALNNGQAPFEQIMLNQIESIEIVRGNVSALYGSKAMGGVIHISTSGQQRDNLVSTAVNYGHDQTRGAHIDWQYKLANTSMQVKVSRQLSDSFPPLNQQQFPQANQQNHSYQNTSVMSQLKQHFNQDWQGGVRFFQTASITQFASPYGSPQDANDSHTNIKNILFFLDGIIKPTWQTHIILAQNSDSNHSYYLNSQTAQTSVSKFDTINRKLSWQHEITLSTHATQPSTLLFGYEYLLQKLSAAPYASPARSIHAFFLGYQESWGKQQLQANLRHDHYSDFGQENSYFIGYGYHLAPTFKTYLNLSNAFRAPTFNDLYFPNFNNEALQPEYARSIELGVQYSQGMQLARLSLFRTLYKNLIDYKMVNQYSIPFNIGKAKVEGIEATITTQLAKLDIRASATLQNSQNQTDDTVLKGRSRHFANIEVSKKWQQFQVGAILQMNGPRIDAFTNRQLSGYSVWDMSFVYQPNKDWTLYTKLANVFNRIYQTIYGYNTPSRGFYLTLAWQPSTLLLPRP